MAARSRWRVSREIALVLVAATSKTLLGQDAIQSRTAPGSVDITSAVAGSPPTAVSNSTGEYRVKVGNGTTKNITAALNSALPPGVTMTITMVAPPGATSVGVVTLSTTPVTVVTNVSNNNFS